MSGSAETGPSVAELRLRLESVLLAVATDWTGVDLRGLRPRDDDYPKVFRPAAIAAARQRYETLWAGPLDFRHPPDGASVEIHLTPAAGLPSCAGFPPGYREAAGLLVPDRLWAAWKYVPPHGAAALSYDGLTWCDSHWAWFPKPFRLLPPPAA